MRRFAFPAALMLTARVVLAPWEARAEGSTSDAESESTTYSLSSTLILASVTAVVAVVVVVVVLTQKDKFPRPPTTAAERMGAGLVAQGLCGADGALAVLLAGLVESPTAMDTFTLEATLGGGAGLEAVGRAAGLPASEIGEAWRRTVGAPSATRAEAFAAVVRFVQDIGPRLAPDPEAAAALIDALAEEQARPDFPARAPAHGRLAAWTGLTVVEVAPVVAGVLAEGAGAPSSRTWRRAHAVALVNTLGMRVAAARPEVVVAQGRALLTRGQALGVRLDEGVLAGL